MKIIYSGLESSGKSYKLGEQSANLVERNSKWFEKSGIQRTVASNMTYSNKFLEYAKLRGVPIVYWENLDDLIKIENADVICDEVGNYFDARMWADLSLDVRRWLTQGAKSGIEFYGSAQDFAQIDKAFRRLVNHLFHITKIVGSRRPSATQPPVKRIWGLCSMRELNPQEYNEDKKSFDKTAVFPSFFYLERTYCEIFDTNQKIKRSKPALLKHIERDCELDNCTFHKLVHI